MRLQTVNICNLCGGKGQAPWKRMGPWTIVKCTNCELKFLNPRPAPESLYSDYHQRLHIEDAPAIGERDAIERGVRAWDERVEWLSQWKSEGQALDMGCASGFFLENLRRRGWKVSGCEIGEWAAQRARSLFGISVKAGDILRADIPEAANDLVTLWDLLEHVADPLAVLTRARRAARKDGVILVRVPNVASLDARVLGANWIDWCLPYHFYHFTPKTLISMAVRAGLAVRRLETEVSSVPLRFLFLPLTMPPHHVKLMARLEGILGPVIRAAAKVPLVPGSRKCLAPARRLAGAWHYVRRPIVPGSRPPFGGCQKVVPGTRPPDGLADASQALNVWRVPGTTFVARRIPGPAMTLVAQPR